MTFSRNKQNSHYFPLYKSRLGCRKDGAKGTKVCIWKGMTWVDGNSGDPCDQDAEDELQGPRLAKGQGWRWRPPLDERSGSLD